MENNVKFAILKYIPDLERNEQINVAVVLHYIDSGKIKMSTINSWKRISSFDDEANIKFLKSYIEDIQEIFSMNLTNKFNGMSLNDSNLLDELTKFFVNKFIFEIHKTTTDMTFSEFLENIKRIYLYYDFEKKDRITEKEVKLFMERNMLENNIKYERICGKNAIHEKYGNNLNIDYKIGDDLYKLIFINKNNYNNYVQTIKMWIANAMLLKEEGKRLIFVFDEEFENEKTKRYKQMLSDFAQTVDKKDLIDFLISKADNSNIRK